MTELRLGAHMSIAGGPANALRRGHSIGCDAIQIFVQSPNRWTSKPLTSQEIEAFALARSDTGIDPIVAHSSYLINLASPKKDLWTRSVEALLLELNRCRQLGIETFVIHPGAHTGSGKEAGLRRIASGLQRVLRGSESDSLRIALEITAGQGTTLGYTFEQLAWLIDHVRGDERLAVCFDTAHAHAAGYTFGNEKTYAEMWRRYEDVIGRDRLAVIHLNDSKRECGSHVDRHEQLGKGTISIEAFRLLVNDPLLRHVPMLLETPKVPDMHEDVKNLALLRSLVSVHKSQEKIRP